MSHPCAKSSSICPFKTHLVFADSQMTANIGPILDPRLGVNDVWILYSANHIENAQRLSNVYKIHHKTLHLVQMDMAFDLLDITANLKKLVAKIPLNTLAINLSGANKMVTLGAFKAFENTPVGIYYLLPNDQLKWIQPPDLAELNIAKTLQLAEFLKAHGIERFKAAELNPEQANFANGLINAIEKIIFPSKALKTYQLFSTNHARGKPIKLVKIAGKYYLNGVVSRSRIQTDLMVGLFRKLHNQGIIHAHFKNDTVNTEPEQNGWKRGFIEGGWLEYLTYRTLLSLKADIKPLVDVAFNVKLQRQSAHDETDVLFLANNQLFLVECKTGSNANINLHLQRLDSLKNRLGGVTAHGLLVTTEPIGVHRNKANLLNIGIIDGTQLPDLRQHLKTWILQEIAQNG